MALLNSSVPLLVRPLGTQEQAGQAGMTHIAVITADNLQEQTVNTLQTITLCALAAKDIIVKVGWILKTPFKDVSDTAFNTTTVSIGDNSAVTTFLAAFEMNANGTSIPEKFSNTAVGPYTAADKITATFNSMAAKALINIDAGELHVFFQLLRMGGMSDSTSGAILTIPKP